MQKWIANKKKDDVNNNAVAATLVLFPEVHVQCMSTTANSQS